MKQAYLIMAHDRPQELRRLLRALDDRRNDIFLHIDSRSPLQDEDINHVVEKSTLTILPSQKVVWGGSSQIEVEMRLFEAAYRHPGQYDYYHLLSGVDYPVKSNDYINRFLESHNGENYISIEEEPPRFRMRFDQYHLLQNTVVGKKRNLWKYIDFASCYVQKMFGVRRFSDKEQLQKHINWVSLTDEAVAVLVSRKESILKRYRWTYCCDEVFVLAELRDSPLKNTISKVGNLRFMEWQWFSKHDSSPRAIGMEDWDALRQPHILFARKFMLPQSKEVYTALEEQVSGDGAR